MKVNPNHKGIKIEQLTFLQNQVNIMRSLIRLPIQIHIPKKSTLSTKHHHSVKKNQKNLYIVRRKTIRYYIGNIGQKSNRAGMIKFLKVYGVEPVGVRIIETLRGRLSAKNNCLCVRQIQIGIWHYMTQENVL